MSVESGDSHFRPVLVVKLATAIYDGYIESDDGEWLRKTGQIFKHRHSPKCPKQESLQQHLGHCSELREGEFEKVVDSLTFQVLLDSTP